MSSFELELNTLVLKYAKEHNVSVTEAKNKILEFSKFLLKGSK